MLGLLLQRELSIRLRSPLDVVYGIVFFLVIITLVPFLLSHTLKTIVPIAPVMTWVAIQLATLLGLEKLFKQDLIDGFLAQVYRSGVSMTAWVMVKILVFWLTTGLLFAGLSLLCIPLYHLTVAEGVLLAFSVLIATPTIALMSATAGALTLSIPSSQMLVPMIALPLQLPVILLACGMLLEHQSGNSILSIMALLIALFIFSLMTLPWFITKLLSLVWE